MPHLQPAHMQKRISALLGMLAIMLVLGACNSQPDHARYIPKDAYMVTGLNAKALTKKVTWNIITGSKLFKQMQEQTPDKKSIDLENSGIDIMSTYYVYVKNSGSISKFVGLVPLSNVAMWESFMKKTFPSATVKPQGARKLASFGNNIYGGWDNNLLIIMVATPNVQNDMMGGSMGGNVVSDSAVAVEMDNAFNVTKENALTGNPRFAKLLAEGHDMIFWMNHEEMMNQYMSGSAAKMMSGITMSKALWKDAVMAAGLDFEKGKIAGDMRTYVGDDMKEVAREMGSTNVDKDMIDRLPKQNLDAAMCLHVSPKGLRAILDKAGLLGLANIALSSQGIDADYALQAFTGDMAVTVNDLQMTRAPKVDITDDGDVKNGWDYKASMNAIYVLKINKKENFNKILQLAVNGNLARINDNTYAMPISSTDSIIIVAGENYAVVTNRSINAAKFLQGSNKGQKSEALTQIGNHPGGLYVDMQEGLKWLTPDFADNNGMDNTKMQAFKSLLENIRMEGGEFKDGAYNYHMSINFMNKDENSLLTLMDFGVKMQQTGNGTNAK